MKLRSTGVPFVVVLAAVAGACGTQAPSESSTPDPTVAALSNLGSDVVNGFFGVTDSIMARLGFGPPDAAIEEPAGAGTEEPADVDVEPLVEVDTVQPTPSARPEVVRRTPRPPSPPPVAPDTAPAVVEQQPIATHAMSSAAEAPVTLVPSPPDPPTRVDDLTVYTAADVDVVPPILRSLDHSMWRPLDGPDVDAVEVVISQEGGVDRVRLVSQTRRMVDIMSLSAVKNWKFEPALKDGEPVRYRLLLQSARPTSYR